jgi:hypothetical protein
MVFMKLILFLYASLSSCKGTANLFDVVLKATLFLNLLRDSIFIFKLMIVDEI